MRKYDVIIVGCGPAGIAAASILKKNNINFCIIEKNKFPREKLCGGGLTHKTILLLDKLGFTLNKNTLKNCKEVEIVSKKISKNMTLDNKIIMIDRMEFDYNNVKQIVNDNLFELENILNIENNIIITNKDKYEFKYVIFADGVNGYSRKLISNRKFGFCVEYKLEKETNKTILDFEAIESGYGWIFPKYNHTTIGLGNFNKKKNDYIKLLISFAKKYNYEIDKTKIKGYFIPVFSKKVFRHSVIDNKYIIVGDASSLVDAVSGEGIYYALYSGMKASESIIASMNSNQSLKEIYFKKTRNMCKSLIKRKYLSKLLYSRYGTFFIKIGLSNKHFVKKLNKMFG